jgi:toxin ParE1/3/4
MSPYQIVLTPGADEDLANIREWIAADASARTAKNYTDDLLEHLAGFADAPHRGSVHDHLARGLRIVGWRRSITILFKVDERSKQVVVHAILSGGRDISAVIARRLPD